MCRLMRVMPCGGNSCPLASFPNPLFRDRSLSIRRGACLVSYVRTHSTIVSCSPPEGDTQTIPPVYRDDDSNGEVHQLPFAEPLRGIFVDVIGNVIFGNQRHRLGPNQIRSFSTCIKIRFSPCSKLIEALFAFAPGTGILRKHVGAIGISIDLRCTILTSSINDASRLPFFRQLSRLDIALDAPSVSRLYSNRSFVEDDSPHIRLFFPVCRS